MGSFDSRAVWDESENGKRESFVWFVQILSDKTVTTMKSTALVAYRIHAVSLNNSLRNSQ